MSEAAPDPDKVAKPPTPVIEAVPLPPPPPAEEIPAVDTEGPATPLTVNDMDSEEKEDQGSPVPPEPEDTVSLEADAIENDGDAEHEVNEVEDSEPIPPMTLPPTEAAEPAEADPAEDIPPPPSPEAASAPEAVELADPAEDLTIGIESGPTSEPDENEISDVTDKIEDMTLGTEGEAFEPHLENDGAAMTEISDEPPLAEPSLDTLPLPGQETEHIVPLEALEEPTEETGVPLAARETDLGQEEATIDQPWSDEPIPLTEEAPTVQQDVSEMNDAPKREKKGKKGKTKTVEIEGQDCDTTLNSVPDTIPETVGDTLPEERRSTRRATGHTREHKSSRTKTKRSDLKTSLSRPHRSTPPRSQRDLDNATRRASSGTSTGFAAWANRALTSLFPSNTNATSMQRRRRSHAGDESLRRRDTGDSSRGETRRKSRKGAKYVIEFQKGDTWDTMPTEAAHTFVPSQPDDNGHAPTTADTEEQTASPSSPNKSRKSRAEKGRPSKKDKRPSATADPTVTAADDDTLPPLPARASTAPAKTIPAPEEIQTRTTGKRHHRDGRETRSSKSGRRTSGAKGSTTTSTNLDVPPPPPPPSPPPTSSSPPTEAPIDLGSSIPEETARTHRKSKTRTHRTTHGTESSRGTRRDGESKFRRRATEDTEVESPLPSSPEITREADTLDTEESPRVRRSGTDPTSRKTTRASPTTRGWSMFSPMSTTKSKRKA